MKAIETTITVDSDQKAMLRVPAEISPGEQAAVIVVAENLTPQTPQQRIVIPVDDVGPWPKDYVVKREDLYDDQV